MVPPACMSSLSARLCWWQEEEGLDEQTLGVVGQIRAERSHREMENFTKTVRSKVVLPRKGQARSRSVVDIEAHLADRRRRREASRPLQEAVRLSILAFLAAGYLLAASSRESLPSQGSVTPAVDRSPLEASA